MSRLNPDTPTQGFMSCIAMSRLNLDTDFGEAIWSQVLM